MQGPVRSRAASTSTCSSESLIERRQAQHLSNFYPTSPGRDYEHIAIHERLRLLNHRLLEELSRAGLEPDESGAWLDDAQALRAVVADADVFVGWLDTAWPDPGTAGQQLRDVVHVPAELAFEIGEVVSQVRRRYAAALRRCRYCGQQRTPGHMHSEDVCHGCAERHLGVVH